MKGHLKEKSWADWSVKSQEISFETEKPSIASILLSFENSPQSKDASELTTFETQKPPVSICAHANSLVKLVDRINWDDLDEQFSPLFSAEGRPAIATRMMAGLTLLQSFIQFKRR